MGDDEEDDLFAPDWMGVEGGVRSAAPIRPKPLRVKDPLIGGVLRIAERFHETLHRPHLLFHIRAFAGTPVLARFLASTVAESAYQKGGYDLFDSFRGDGVFEAVTVGRDGIRAMPVPALDYLLGGRKLYLFDGLGRLANVAPAEELASAVRLPLASYGSPCCIRKNTDPPRENADDIVVLGYDEQSFHGGNRHGKP